MTATKGGKSAAIADAVAAAIKSIYADALRSDSQMCEPDARAKKHATERINGLIGEPAIVAFLNADKKGLQP